MLKLPLETSKTSTLYVAKSNSNLSSASPRKSDNLRMSTASPKNYSDIYEIHSPTSPQKNGVSPRKTSKTVVLAPLSPYGKQVSETKSPFGVESELSSFDRASPGLSIISNQTKAKELSKMDHLFREDYGGAHKKPYKPKEDAEDVKRLDEWQMSLKRNQCKYYYGE